MTTSIKRFLPYPLLSGKPVKLFYYIRAVLRELVPAAWCRYRLAAKLHSIDKRADANYIRARVAYYNKITHSFSLATLTHGVSKNGGIVRFVGRIADFKFGTCQKVYYIDLREVTRYFSPNALISYYPGDVYEHLPQPSLVKSRLLTSGHENSVLMKLDKHRHFMFVKDPYAWEDKMNRIVFRGKIRESRLRRPFLERYFDHPMVDAGVVGRNEGYPTAWEAPKMSIEEHLHYKFILSLEGNDVATNLKWVMSSNSIAVMTRPTCETWFMEGCLQPGVHYIEIANDLSNLEAQLNYYIAHPDEAKRIIANAHAWVEQFRDHEREELISLQVMQQYLKQSGQSTL
ncbi:MAG: glycosyl transferase family 90 [Bacteroidales bacterium]|nr:glycosyl transferase family 90 [Bacteroidales bacterium]